MSEQGELGAEDGQPWQSVAHGTVGAEWSASQQMTVPQDGVTAMFCFICVGAGEADFCMFDVSGIMLASLPIILDDGDDDVDNTPSVDAAMIEAKRSWSYLG